MENSYKINSIYNSDGKTFSEIINSFLLSFLEKEFIFNENNAIINSDIISNL